MGGLLTGPLQGPSLLQTTGISLQKPRFTVLLLIYTWLEGLWAGINPCWEQKDGAHVKVAKDKTRGHFETNNAANLTKRCEDRRTPPRVPLGGYQCQMFYKTGVHHLLTRLNKASRSTRCCDNNNMALPNWTRSCLLQCTLDLFGKSH